MPVCHCAAFLKAVSHEAYSFDMVPHLPVLLPFARARCCDYGRSQAKEHIQLYGWQLFLQ